MHDNIGYSRGLRTVQFQKGDTAELLWCYVTSVGNNPFSIKLAPHPPNGRSCQFAFGGSPVSCGDLELSTTSQFGVSKQFLSLFFIHCFCFVERAKFL